MLVIKAIFSGVFYSIRNALLYREHRYIAPPREVTQKARNDDIDEIRLAITNYMLAGVGLKVNDVDALRFVYLTKAQRQAIKLVKEFGYSVGIK